MFTEEVMFSSFICVDFSLIFPACVIRHSLGLTIVGDILDNVSTHNNMIYNTRLEFFRQDSYVLNLEVIQSCF